MAGGPADLLGHVIIEFFHAPPDPAEVAGDFGEHQPAVALGGLHEPGQVGRPPVHAGHRRPRQQLAAPPRLARCLLNL